MRQYLAKYSLILTDFVKGCLQSLRKVLDFTLSRTQCTSLKLSPVVDPRFLERGFVKDLIFLYSLIEDLRGNEEKNVTLNPLMVLT